jgi:2-oxoisovalerate dehydrogenase E2 component (dihydrolipoyl transacylase)
MGEHLIKMPDVGEGIAEAELVEWHVKVGDLVREDAVLAAVMTDKATVEIPSPVDGEVLWLGADIGDVVAIGSPLIRLKVEGEGSVAAAGPVAVKAAEEPARAPAAASSSPTISGARMPYRMTSLADSPSEKAAMTRFDGRNARPTCSGL